MNQLNQVTIIMVTIVDQHSPLIMVIIHQEPWWTVSLTSSTSSFSHASRGSPGDPLVEMSQRSGWRMGGYRGATYGLGTMNQRER